MSLLRYPAYKDSAVEWLGAIPEHWEVSTLKRILAVPITDGPHETPQFTDVGVPFVSAEAVSSGHIDFSKARACISHEDNLRYSAKYSPKLHDIYMVKSGAPTGATALVEDRTDFNIWSPLAALRCGSDALPHFVLNFMRSQNFQEAVKLSWSFGTQQNIGMGVIGNLPCLLPPRAEQVRIAMFLGRETAKIEALVEEQRRLVELLKEKRQAIIAQAVTKGLSPDARMKPSGIEWLGDVPDHWEVVQFKQLVDIKNGSDYKHVEEAEGYPVYGSGGVFAHASQFLYDGESVLLGRKGTIDKPLYVVGRFWTVDTMYWTKIKAGSFGRFVYYSALTIPFAYYSTNTALPSMTSGTLNGHNLLRPPVEEQASISAFLDRETAHIDALLVDQQRLIELLKERQTALISAAVTGQIDVRNWSKESVT